MSKSGVTGPQGPTGPQGTAGTANVVYSGWITIDQNIRDPTIDGSALVVSDIPAPGLTGTIIPDFDTGSPKIGYN